MGIIESRFFWVREIWFQCLSVSESGSCRYSCRYSFQASVPGPVAEVVITCPDSGNPTLTSLTCG